MSEWISIEDGLPFDQEIVLVCDMHNEFFSLGKFSDNEDLYEFALLALENVKIDTYVTHWMRVPQLPVFFIE